MTRYGETEADDFFRHDAHALGYLDDVHAPGNGRGLRAYYRDNGMVQPEVLEKEIIKTGTRVGRDAGGKEITGVELDQLQDPHCSACARKSAQLRGTDR